MKSQNNACFAVHTIGNTQNFKWDKAQWVVLSSLCQYQFLVLQLGIAGAVIQSLLESNLYVIRTRKHSSYEASLELRNFQQENQILN